MYRVPLTKDQLLTLGYIAVVWGQIDQMLDEILAHAHGFDKVQRESFLTDKLAATKLDMLAKAIDRLPEKVRDDTRTFVEKVNNTKGRRNAAFHGVWGLFAPDSVKATKDLRPASHHKKTIDNPLKAIELAGLAKDLTEATLVGGRAMCALLGFPFAPHLPFIWGTGANYGEPPSWLRIEIGSALAGRLPEDRRKSKPGIQPKSDPEKDD